MAPGIHIGTYLKWLPFSHLSVLDMSFRGIQLRNWLRASQRLCRPLSPPDFADEAPIYILYIINLERVVQVLGRARPGWRSPAAPPDKALAWE